MALTLGFIVEKLGGTLLGSAQMSVAAIAPLESASCVDISFLSNPLYVDQLDTTRAGCIIVAEAHRQRASARGACIVCDNPYHYFALLTQLWREQNPVSSESEPLIHPTAFVHPRASVHSSARIGPQ